MTYTQEDISGKHSDFCAWADWFVKEQVRRGATKPNADFIGSVLFAFLDSGKAYLAQQESSIDCPKCQGKGHSNLFLLGQDKPSPCGNCKGTGRIKGGE